MTDSARDLLMGLHIAWFKELPMVGHWAYGVGFPYPPYYYYFLGVLSYISTDLFFIFAVFVFIQLLGVLALFKIGSILFDKKTGLLCGFFYSISVIMVVSGSMIETVFFNIPIFLSSFYTFVLFYKTNRILFVDEDVPGGTSAYMMQQVLETQGGFSFLDSAPRTLPGKPHRPAYGTDGNYWSKPEVEHVFESAYEIMHEVNPSRFPLFFR